MHALCMAGKSRIDIFCSSVEWDDGICHIEFSGLYVNPLNPIVNPFMPGDIDKCLLDARYFYK